jgi:hypothetical protein
VAELHPLWQAQIRLVLQVLLAGDVRGQGAALAGPEVDVAAQRWLSLEVDEAGLDCRQLPRIQLAVAGMERRSRVLAWFEHTFTLA